MHLQTKDLVRVRGIEQLSLGHMASREMNTVLNRILWLCRAPCRRQVSPIKTRSMPRAKCFLPKRPEEAWWEDCRADDITRVSARVCAVSILCSKLTSSEIKEQRINSSRSHLLLCFWRDEAGRPLKAIFIYFNFEGWRRFLVSLGLTLQARTENGGVGMTRLSCPCGWLAAAPAEADLSGAESSPPSPPAPYVPTQSLPCLR